MRTGWAVLAFAIAIPLAATAGAQDQRDEGGAGGHPRGKHGMREGFRPEQALKLTETQSASWDQLHRQHREALRPLFEKGRGLHDQIRRQLESSKPDPTALGKLMISAHALHGQREAARKDLDEKLAQILDPEQKAKWDLMKEMRGGQRDGWGHGMPMGPRGPMGPDADEPEPPDSE